LAKKRAADTRLVASTACCRASGVAEQRTHLFGCVTITTGDDVRVDLSVVEARASVTTPAFRTEHQARV
jgi:hypothetical protein